MTTTLLAVDDSRTLRKVFEITFAGEPQFRLVVAESAQDAMSKLGHAQPRVALVDATLPDQNGYDLCRQIKGQSPSTSVIMLSSKQNPYDRARGAAAGADDFIDKPFDTQQLIDKVVHLSQASAAPLQPAGASLQASVVALPKPAPPPGAFSAPPGNRQPAVSAVPEARRMKSMPPPKPKSVTPAVPGVAPHAAMVGSIGAAASSQLSQQLSGLGLSAEQVEAVTALSRDVVERVVWEVVPVIAETLIKEEIRRLTAE